MKITFKNGVLIFIGLIVLIFLAPLVCFWVGYFLGIIAKVLIGDSLINGINCICKTNLTKDSIPLIAGTLSWIACFFKTYKFDSKA